MDKILRIAPIALMIIGLLCLSQQPRAQLSMTDFGGAGGGVAGYAGPGDCSGCPTGAQMFYSFRSYTASYATPGTNNAVALYSNALSTNCPIPIATGGNLSTTTAASGCTAGGTSSALSAFCATTCTVFGLALPPFPFSDQTGNGNNAAAAGSTTTPVFNLTGGPGSSALNGPVQYFTVSGGIGAIQYPGALTSLSPFSMVAWINVSSFGAYYGIIGSGTSGSIEVRVDATTGTLTVLSLATAAYCTSSTGISTGWHQVAVTFTSGTNGCKFYMDGSALGTAQTPSGSTFTTGTIGQWGDSSGGGDVFTGGLAELIIYNTVLTSGQISAIYNNTSP